MKEIFGDALQKSSKKAAQAAETAAAKEMKKLRDATVKAAWRQERAIVMAGGTGSRKWTAPERKQLIKDGYVTGYQGHHINSVASSPTLAGTADNISFETAEAHAELHLENGGFGKPTSGQLFDRNTMYRDLTGSDLPSVTRERMTYDDVVNATKRAFEAAGGSSLGIAALTSAFYGLQALDKISPESMLFDPGYYSWETIDGTVYGESGAPN